MGFLHDFKTFAMRGNVVDMAVGVVIGGAFGKIVTSLVNDLIMPLVSASIGEGKFKNMKILLKPAITLPDGTETAAITLNYGAFIQTAVDFLIIAFCIFVFIKIINNMKKKEAEAPSEPPPPSKEEVLLGEIRDLLKAKS